MRDGTVKMPDGYIVSGDLTLPAFLNSKYGSSATPLVKNGDYVSYRFSSYLRENISCIWTIYFSSDKILEAHLYPEWSETAKSWNEYASELEMRNKRQNDSFLEQELGCPPYEYSWGKIISSFDQKSGSSLIIVRYSRDMH